MAAYPVPIVDTRWDGTRGQTRWYAGWQQGDTDLTDSVVLDISALVVPPLKNAVKVRSFDLLLNGNFTVTLRYAQVWSGVVVLDNTARTLTWTSGDKFGLDWVGQGDTIVNLNDIGALTIVSVDSATQLTYLEDAGAGSDGTYLYYVDEFIDRFVGQDDATHSFYRKYSDGPNLGVPIVKGSAGLVGDILLTTSGAASSDEVNIKVVFERS